MPFYVHIRPYLAGSKGLDAFPEGLLYEGVDSKPLRFNGGSGAESSTLQAIDAVLGTQHKGTDAEFLKDMRSYMPAKHREFLEYISQEASLHQYIVRVVIDLELAQQYNATVINYGSSHIIIVTRYISIQHTV